MTQSPTDFLAGKIIAQLYSSWSINEISFIQEQQSDKVVEYLPPFYQMICTQLRGKANTSLMNSLLLLIDELCSLSFVC